MPYGIQKAKDIKLSEISRALCEDNAHLQMQKILWHLKYLHYLIVL